MAIIAKLKSVLIICLLAFLVLQLKNALHKKEEVDENPVHLPWHATESGFLSSLLRKLYTRSDPPSEGEASGDDSDAFQTSLNRIDLDEPASEGEWNALIGKGCILLGMIGMNIDEADSALKSQGIQSQSQFTDYSDLHENGWDSQTFGSSQDPFGSYIFMSRALNALGLSYATTQDKGSNNAVEWKQDRGGNYKGSDFDVSQNNELVTKELTWSLTGNRRKIL